MSEVIDLSKADEKMATLDLVLKADSGFQRSSKGDRISANQWSSILLVVAGSEAYRTMRAAPEMLEVLAWIAGQSNLLFAECSQAEEIIQRAKAAIAKATGAA